MNDTRLRIYGQLAIIVISFICFYLFSVIDAGISLWKLLLYIAVTTFTIWEGLRLFILFARNRYPAIAQTQQRLALVTFFTLLMVAVFPFIKFALSDFIHLYGETHTPTGSIRMADYLRIVGQNIFYCLFITAVYEAIYFFKLWKQMFQQTEALKKEQLASQFHSLKEQVSPHFLFNSLNTLSSLVSRNTVQAERFIEEMAAVYRYLLDMSTRYLVTLEEELAFVESYTHLLQTRYNNQFEVVFEITPEQRELQLPPLTLQLLIENAVKHNVVDSRNPLVLFIQSNSDQTIMVQNRIQKRRQPVRSERKGLANIMTRYELLGLPAVQIEETSEFFSVIVPLKPSSIYAGANY